MDPKKVDKISIGYELKGIIKVMDRKFIPSANKAKLRILRNLLSLSASLISERIF